MTDRRKEPRVGGGGVRARVRLGHRLVIVDLSARGALVEGQCPLRPGSRIEIQLDSEARGAMVIARVVRSVVAALHPESGVTYRTALAFNESCDWVREGATRGGYDLPKAPRADAAIDGDCIPGGRSAMTDGRG